MALSQKNLLGKVLNKVNSFFIKKKDWQDIEYFDDEWRERIAFMATFITPGSSVMDLGCGKMWLKDYIPADCTYFPVDYCKRSPETIVADFNKKEFPSQHAEILFISGCLEYVRSYEWFISSICRKSDRVILSYCTTNYFPDERERKTRAWKNHLSELKVTELFMENNFQLVHQSITKANNSIFVFDKQ
jgi:hypothetical protein